MAIVTQARQILKKIARILVCFTDAICVGDHATTSRIGELVQFGLSNDRKHLNEAVYLSLGVGVGGGAVIQNPWGRSQNKSFSALRASLWSKNKGGRPPGGSPWIRPTEIMVHSPMFTQV